MNVRRMLPIAVCVLALVASAGTSSAACMNKFLARTESSRHVVTLLTGKLTFEEAQILAKSISSRQAPPVEWVDEKGKTIARQFGDIKVVRPMPVGCDGKASGVVLIVTFAAGQQPSKTMFIKLDANTTVAFEEQPA